MIYGYCRKSTQNQHIERQVKNILAVEPKAVLYQESYSGTTMDRPQFKRLCDRLVSGDTIIFDSVSRMSRTAEDGYETYIDLYNKGINLVFLKEPHINTDVFRDSSKRVVPMTDTKVDVILDAINQYLFELAKEQIRIAFDQSQKEVDDLHQRTSEGIRVAQLNGKHVGRKQGAIIETKKSIKAKEIILKHAKAFGGTLSDNEMIKLCGITRNTYFKYKKELNFLQ